MAEVADDLRTLVQEHHADIQVIKSDLGTLRSSTISNGQKLDRLIETMTKAGTATIDNMAQRLAIVKDLALLVAMAVAAIVYVSSNAATANNFEREKEVAVRAAILEYRLNALISGDKRVAMMDQQGK